MQTENVMRAIMAKANDKVKRLRFQCLLRDCTSPAINSHSQSYANSLRNIAEGGRVVGLNWNLFSALAGEDAVDSRFREVGIREAATFPGFCSAHDSEFFRSVDNIDLDNLDKEMFAKLAFRTLAMEARIKEEELCRRSTIVEEGRGVLDARFVKFLEDFSEGVRLFLTVDFPYDLNKFERMFRKSAWDDVRSVVSVIDRNIGISCSTFINPRRITKDDPYLGLLNEPQPSAFFTVLPHSSATIVVLTYFLEYEQLVSKFIAEHDKLEEIVFNHCEEVLFNPTFFKSLGNEVKRQIVEGLRHWMSWKRMQFPSLFGVRLSWANVD